MHVRVFLSSFPYFLKMSCVTVDDKEASLESAKAYRAGYITTVLNMTKNSQ